MYEKKTVCIKVWGIVQGVGFRPFVAKLADRLAISGEVRNLGGLVEIVMTESPERINLFVETLKREKPIAAEIVHIRIDDADFLEFQNFKIKDSGEGTDDAAMIPADLALCEDCLQEFWDEKDPRYLHPFISCMACGPRYTIIDKVPYDRENTSMIDFPMCDFCESEYTERSNRRYHAQTISCHDCGPMLRCRGTNISVEAGTNEEMMALAGKKILAGEIIALKGVGGYYFVCSPFIQETVKALRRLKQREEKPFALMFGNLEEIEKYCYAGKEEQKLLSSSARPIVLLERKEQENGICAEVCQSSRFIGAFLPSMGVQHLLLKLCGPLIMTSANLSDRPIIKDDEEMFALALTGVFYNERKIRVRLDDSVVRVIDGQPQIIRRSKGYAPVPLYINNHLDIKQMVLAAGGQLKAAFTLTKGSFAYVSQSFGDLDGIEAEQIYNEGLSHMKELFRITPKLIVSDLHPLYYTTHFAENYAAEKEIPLLKVQHHHAHVASVMAEHDIKGPVIGVSFDGTGYGTDGAIWGGEFLLCRGAEFERKAQLEYIKMLGGDASMKEGWKSAMSYAKHCGCETRFEGSAAWPIVKAGIENEINTIKSSSMGRLFDAVAAFLSICEENRYEGECAIMLENKATEAIKRGLPPYPMDFAYRKTGKRSEVLSQPIFQSLNRCIEEGADVCAAALGFHKAVARMILEVCLLIRSEEKGMEEHCQVALTGGVFQNKILMEESLRLLRAEGFRVFYNISVAPNDGGISLGQAWLGMEYLLSQNAKSNL